MRLTLLILMMIPLAACTHKKNATIAKIEERQKENQAAVATLSTNLDAITAYSNCKSLAEDEQAIAACEKLKPADPATPTPADVTAPADQAPVSTPANP